MPPIKALLTFSSMLLAQLLALPAMAKPEYPVPVIEGFIPTGNAVRAGLFSTDGKVLWASNGQQLKAFDTRSGRQIQDEGWSRGWDEAYGTAAFKVLFNGSLGANSIRQLTAISPDGRFIGLRAYRENFTDTAMVWDNLERRMRHADTGLGDVYGFSPDSRWMIVKGAGQQETRNGQAYRAGPIEVRDVLTNAVLKTLSDDGTATVADDGSLLVIRTGDKRLLLTHPYEKKGRKLGSKDPLPFQSHEPRKRVADTPYTAEFIMGKGLLRLTDTASGHEVAAYPLQANAQLYLKQIAELASGASKKQAQMNAAHEAALATRIAARPADYQSFLVNFEPLPAQWALDYSSLRGRDITAHAWSRHWGPFFSGETFNALGKVGECANGGAALLTLTRSLRNGADIASFQLLILDVDGKPLTTLALGQTQKDSSGRPLAFNLSIARTATDADLSLHQVRWDGEQRRKIAVNFRNCAAY